MEKQINEKKALVPKAFLCYKLIKRTPSQIWNIFYSVSYKNK